MTHHNRGPSADSAAEPITIEALPGLVRAGTPLVENDGTAVVAIAAPTPTAPDWPDEVWVARVSASGTAHTLSSFVDTLSVNLSGPTGFFHLRLWVAELLKLDTSGGVSFGPHVGGGGVWWMTAADGEHHAFGPGPGHCTTVGGLAGLSRVEALRAIALHLHAQGGEE